MRPELFEPVDDLLGGLAINAKTLLAEVLPSQAERAILFPVRYLAQTLGIGGRTAPGGCGERLLTPDPRAQLQRLLALLKCHEKPPGAAAKYNALYF